MHYCRLVITLRENCQRLTHFILLIGKLLENASSIRILSVVTVNVRETCVFQNVSRRELREEYVDSNP